MIKFSVNYKNHEGSPLTKIVDCDSVSYTAAGQGPLVFYKNVDGDVIDGDIIDGDVIDGEVIVAVFATGVWQWAEQIKEE